MSRRWGRIRDELRQALSPECFAELVARFGGQRIRIPPPRVLTQLERRRREVAALDEGESYSAVAEAVGVARSTVVRDAKRST